MALGKKCRRAYKVSELEIESNLKKLKIAAFSISSFKEIKSWKLPEILKNAGYLYLFWMIVLCIAPSATPMWVGWNSILSVENKDVNQNVWCLSQINESPT